MSEVTYEEAKNMLCGHLKKVLLQLEKLEIRCDDGWSDWITCNECNCSMNLTDSYDPKDFKKKIRIYPYPIDSICIKDKTYDIIGAD